MFSLGSTGVKSTKPSFVSYVTPEEVNQKRLEILHENNPDLLPGEVTFCSAYPVLKCTREEGLQQNIAGTLLCTNFRVSFISDPAALEDIVQPFKNKLYGENDIPLTCVDQIYGEYDDKRKLILSGQVKNKHPSKIIIHCKDLRVLHFSLKEAKDEVAKKIFQGIVHHSLQFKSLRCVFAFSYCEKATAMPVDITRRRTTQMFDTADDWMEEVRRTKGNCKLLEANKSFRISQKLPEFFFIPTNLREENLTMFQGKGIPIWCWSHRNGCALFKTSALPLVQEESESKAQKIYMDKMLGAVAHNGLHNVKTEELSETLPSIQDIQQSYCKFKQNFLIDNIAEFWISDVKWFSTLETSRWFSLIRQCLHKAVEVVECLERQNLNILLIEEGGADLTCVVSSLVQLMLDPHYRTLTGFQSLLQKEWIAGGHNFLDRCNHLHSKDKEAQSPVFLLFLECVWQLLQQHSPAFQFTETYLTVLSDSVNVAIFSTFLFSTPHQRATVMKTEAQTNRDLLNIPTVWDWSLQFDCKSQEFFINPLYKEIKPDKSQLKPQRPKTLRQQSLPSEDPPEKASQTTKKHVRQQSLTFTDTPPKKGFFKEETESLKKMLRGMRISRWIQLPDSMQASVRDFCSAWQSRPLDYHSLLLPYLDGSSIRLWTQRYLRWIPEVQIFGGGDVALLAEITSLAQEVDRLWVEVEQKATRARPEAFSPAPFTRSCLRLSSSFPFTAPRTWSFKPAIPTSLHDGYMDVGHLADKDDEDPNATYDVL